jgi:regulatory protein YycH of two-component signal transduction system YycFG
MEDSTTLISFILFVWSILGIILFFKIWGMTNDVRELKNKFLADGTDKVIKPQQENTTNQQSNAITNPDIDTTKDHEAFKIGDIALYEPENRKVKIEGITTTGSYNVYMIDNPTEKYCFQPFVLRHLKS